MAWQIPSAYLWKVQRRIEQLSTHIGKNTFLSLLLSRYVSGVYIPSSYQLTLDDVIAHVNHESAAFTTPWDIIANRKSGSFSIAINDAVLLLKSRFPSVRGFLDENESYEADETVLNELIRLLSDIPSAQDFIALLYENFVRKDISLFPAAITAKSGDFYTPRGVIRCIGALLDLKKGTVYDPCCGSGAMLIGAAQTAPEGSELFFFGQTHDSETYKICRINFMLRNLDVDLGELHANALINDQHEDKTFDYIIANPPFNASNWDEGYASFGDNRRWRYGVPPRSNGNFAWLQHILSHLKENGSAAVILPNGTLTTRVKSESRIREAILCDRVVEAVITFPAGLFYTTKIPFCVWLLKRSEKHGKILLIDAERLNPKIGNTMTPANTKQIEELISNYRKGILPDKSETHAVVTPEELAQRDYILSPNWYTSSGHASPANLLIDMVRFRKCIDELKTLLAGKSILSHIEQWGKADISDISLTSWTKAALPELYSVFGGIVKNKEAFKQGIPMLDVKTVIHCPFIPNILNSRVRASEAEAAKYNILYGDVFLNRTSETIDELACCCVAVKSINAVYTGYVKRLRPKDRQTIYPPYAAGYFRSSAYRREIADVSTVFTTRASMDEVKLSGISVYYPEKIMQQKIGDTLLMVFQYLQDHPNTEQRTLLMEFEHLLIEQYITYPIYMSFRQGGIRNEKNEQS